MRRREFITLIGCTGATFVIEPAFAAATSPKRRVIGVPVLFDSKIGLMFTDMSIQGLQYLIAYTGNRGAA